MVDPTENEARCLLDDCAGISVNATSTSCPPSGGGIIGVFTSNVSISVSDAMVKLDEGIVVLICNQYGLELFNNLSDG
jgi:hypothetical protein